MTTESEAEAQAVVDALLEERKPIQAAWQADVFNPEKLKALERFDTRLMLANRRLGQAQGAEYPNDRAYYAEVGENEDEDEDETR